MKINITVVSILLLALSFSNYAFQSNGVRKEVIKTNAFLTFKKKAMSSAKYGTSDIFSCIDDLFNKLPGLPPKGSDKWKGYRKAFHDMRKNELKRNSAIYGTNLVESCVEYAYFNQNCSAGKRKESIVCDGNVFHPNGHGEKANTPKKAVSENTGAKKFEVDNDLINEALRQTQSE